jgi:hypothetical protein
VARRRRSGGRGRTRRSGVGWGGLLILGLAATGIWIGAGLVEGDGMGIFPALERDPAGEEVEERPIPSYDARIRVEILNAGGVRGMAAEARDALRERGFDVVHYGNARTFGQEVSVVLHRGGGLEAARSVAAALGIAEVRSEPDSTLLVEVTVLLGSAWDPAGAGVGSDEGRQPEGER